METKTADLYLRLSDLRNEEALDGREARLRAEAARLGWAVARVIVENDAIVNGNGKLRPASAFKRRKITTPSGRVELRTVRPGYRSMLDDITSGRAQAILAEDLDRACRDPRDLEDLIDACEQHRASARSLSGSLTLTDGGTDAEITMARNMVTFANKSSRDTARRVAEGRERHAGKSYGGGRRPYGFRVAEGTEQYHRNLVIDQAEAEVLRAAAADILDHGISLRALARDLREQGTPTVTGVPWTESTLRDVLSKPATAGLASYKGELREAPWPAILPRDRWERLTDLFTSHKTGRAPEPRWLVSCYATCGVCGGVVKSLGTSARRAYTCRDGGHVRRAGEAVDAYIEGAVIERLSQPDIADLLRPPPRPGTDAATLRKQARKLRAKRAKMGELFAADAITEDQLTSGTRAIKARLALVEAQLAASDQPDPLADFRDRPAAAVWESLSLPRRRAVVRLLMRVTILPAARQGARFSPDSVRIEWITDG